MTEDTERRGGALILHLHATCEDDKAKQKKKNKNKNIIKKQVQMQLISAKTTG